MLPQRLFHDNRCRLLIRLGDPESADRYRYDGLRLVQRSGDRYLLMSEQWDARTSRIVVLRDSDAIRMELTR